MEAGFQSDDGIAQLRARRNLEKSPSTREYTCVPVSSRPEGSQRDHDAVVDSVSILKVDR